MPQRDKDNPFGFEPFQGQAVKAVGIEVNNVGGGLDRNIELDEEQAVAMGLTQIGDTIFITAQLDATGVNHKAMADGDGVQRRIVFRAVDVAKVDEDLVGGALREQRDRNNAEQERRDKAEADRKAAEKGVKGKSQMQGEQQLVDPDDPAAVVPIEAGRAVSTAKKAAKKASGAAKKASAKK